MYEELIQRAKALDEKATPGPWMWDMRTAHHTCQLVTAHSGQYYVMQFSRWGMQDACPEFQQFKRYSGPVTERGGLGMVRADKMAKSYPGKEHHKGFDDYIDHPDAVFIAESRELVTELIEAVTTLRAENAEKDKRLEAKETIIRLHEPTMGILSAQKDEAIHRMKAAEAALSRVEAERDAANGYLEKIDGMFGTAYPNEILAVLEEWRGAQGEA